MRTGAQHFGADASVLNKTILVNNTENDDCWCGSGRICGHPGRTDTEPFCAHDDERADDAHRNGLDDWNDSWLAILARRKPGVSLQQAEAGINAEYRPLLEQQLATIKQWDEKKRQTFLKKKIVLSSGAQGRTTLQRDSGPALSALFAMAALVLLISCTNVANILLAQGAARQREFAIRTALGAGRGRVMRQVMAESLLCASQEARWGSLLGPGLWTF